MCNFHVELDAHTDTPMETLHVILLGFLKYFWCNAMQRISQEQKKLLIIRLAYCNVGGLNLSPLPGKTLVQYAGSLTGRDFHAISQVAPFMLYDLLLQQCFNAWLALCKLIPLVWQPVINNVETHIVRIDFKVSFCLTFLLNYSLEIFA